MLELPEEAVAQRPFLRPVDGGKEQTGEEGKVIDEEAEFGLVLLPKGWAVESESEEDHIDAREQAGLGEEGP
jgi:hypothetical protein